MQIIRDILILPFKIKIIGINLSIEQGIFFSYRLYFLCQCLCGNRETDTKCFEHNSVVFLSKSIFISTILLSFTMLHELVMENSIILLHKIVRLVLKFFLLLI